MPPSTTDCELRTKSAFCVALATVGTMLILGALRIPHSYMGLVFSATLSVMPKPSLEHFLLRIVAVSFGTVTSVLLLVIFPEEPWFYIPLLGVISAYGYAFFLARWGPGSACAFSFYFLAIHVSSIAGHFTYSVALLALNFWAQAVIAIIMTYIAACLTKKKATVEPSPKLPLSSIVTIGIAVSIAGLIDASIRTDQGGRLIMATISTITILETTQLITPLIDKFIGYLIGIVVAASFIVITIAAGNDFGVYLLFLGITFGSLEWLACYYLPKATIYRSIAMMISFCVLMLPAPDTSLHIPYQRALVSLAGFFIAIIAFVIGRECKKITLLPTHLKKRNSQG
ncbi:MAG: hypothetical protein A3F67_07340 [Verrucomicrobia bacterium RIFCSPHIGHO2_12_FULL_41_10]|nr:MAG: hypothetical protein A3F67_07340 [Verrucomicrobia bacterium RIFCSPHIGHO2_12_FULL_41_10]HLB33728.1 hypothetical protein [Chthoniobacterales bacterium]